MSRRRRSIMRRSAAEREQLEILDQVTRRELETYDSRDMDPNDPASWRATWGVKP